MWVLLLVGCFGRNVSVFRDTGMTDFDSDGTADTEGSGIEGDLTVSYVLVRAGAELSCADAGVAALTISSMQSDLSVPCDDEPIVWLGAPAGERIVQVEGDAASGGRYAGDGQAVIDPDEPAFLEMTLDCQGVGCE